MLAYLELKNIELIDLELQKVSLIFVKIIDESFNRQILHLLKPQHYGFLDSYIKCIPCNFSSDNVIYKTYTEERDIQILSNCFNLNEDKYYSNCLYNRDIFKYFEYFIEAEFYRVEIYENLSGIYKYLNTKYGNLKMLKRYKLENISENMGTDKNGDVINNTALFVLEKFHRYTLEILYLFEKLDYIEPNLRNIIGTYLVDIYF